MLSADTSPLVSVCIPVRNCAAYIGEAIASVLNQTYSNFELVVIDDASTDATVDVIRSFRDTRIVTHHNPSNIGVCANWNLAITRARGNYVKLLCADDILYPTCLEEQAGIFRSDSDHSLALVCCPRDIIDPEGRIRLRSRGWPNSIRDCRIEGRRAVRHMARMGRNLIGEPLCVLFRRDAALGLGGFDPHVQLETPFCLDWDLWCRLLQTGDLFINKAPHGAFRVNPGSASLGMVGTFATDDRIFLHRLRDKCPAELTYFDIHLGTVRSWRDAWLRRLFYAFLALHS